MPASDEEISSSPAAISRNGAGDLDGAEQKQGAGPAAEAAERTAAPRRAATSTSAASAIRAPGDHRRREVADADLDEHVARSPDRGEDQAAGSRRAGSPVSG